MRKVVPFILGCLLWVCSSPIASGGPPISEAPALTEEERAFFAWWDELGFPDVRVLQFGLAWTGASRGTLGQDPTQAPEPGFLLEESDTRFTAFLTNLRTVTFDKTGPEEKPWHRRAFDRTDLGAFVVNSIAVLTQRNPETARFGEEMADPFVAHRWARPNLAFRLAVIARALAARGQDGLARVMCDRARHEANWRYGRNSNMPVASTELATFDRLKQTIESEARVVLEAGYADPALTWEDLLTNTERWAKAFHPEALAEPEGDLAKLRRIVEERKRAGERPPKAGEPPSLAERVASLVHDLQDARSSHLESYGMFSAFRRDKEDKGPIGELVRLGLQAVPALILALDDERPTRGLRWRESGQGAHRDRFEMLTVGEVAWLILDHVSGDELGKPDTRDSPTRGPAVRREAAEAWYAKVRDRGLESLLIAQVEAGGDNARVAAERLYALNPDAALRAIEVGIGAGAGRDSGQTNLAYFLAWIPGEFATAALLRVRNSLRDSDTALEIAKRLWKRGRREGLDWMIAAWRALGPGGDGARYSFFSGERSVASALVDTAQAEAIAALGEDLAARNVDSRVGVVIALSRTLAQPGKDGPDVLARPTPEVEQAIEKLLAGRLVDDEREAGSWFGTDLIGDEPVVGELALLALATRYPARYAIESDGSATVRARARIAAANEGRARQGAPLLPLPRWAAVPPAVPLTELRAELDRAVLAPDETTRAAALDAIETRGLAAFPAVREALATIAPEAPGRAGLVTLTARLSFRVLEAVVEDGSLPLPATLAEALVKMNGGVFTGTRFYELWSAFAASAPEPGTALTVRAERDARDGGVRLSVRLAMMRLEPGGDSGLSFWLPKSRRAGTRVFSRSGRCSLAEGVTPDTWKDAAEEMQAAIDAAGFTISFETHAQISAEK